MTEYNGVYGDYEWEIVGRTLKVFSCQRRIGLPKVFENVNAINSEQAQWSAQAKIDLNHPCNKRQSERSDRRRLVHGWSAWLGRRQTRRMACAPEGCVAKPRDGSGALDLLHDLEAANATKPVALASGQRVLPQPKPPQDSIGLAANAPNPTDSSDRRLTQYPMRGT